MFNKLKEITNKSRTKDNKMSRHGFLPNTVEEFDEFVKEEEQRIKSELHNDFDVNETVTKIKETLGEEMPKAIYLGFNLVRTEAEIVILTDAGYVFVPLEGQLELATVCWGNSEFLRLYYAQEKLSNFLEALGKELNTKVIDRCLYISWIKGPLFDSVKINHDVVLKRKEYILQKQETFCQKYSKQLDELKEFNDDWLAYHNHGFEFRYAVPMALLHAQQELYDNRKVLEENGLWSEADAVIHKLDEIMHH